MSIRFDLTIGVDYQDSNRKCVKLRVAGGYHRAVAEFARKMDLSLGETMNRTGAIVAIAIAAASVGLSSCALVFHGTNEDITVNSDPPGAMATLSSGETRVTPFAITVPRKQDIEIHFVKPGYNPTDVTDESQVEAGYLIVDILTLAWPYDAATGAYFAHQQSTIEAKLVPIETGTPGGATRVDSQLPQGKVSASVAGEDTN